MKQIQREYYFSLFLILIFILPFIYLSKYVVLISDDFCRVAPFSFSNYLQAIKFWYLNLNGRFINAIISSIPTYNILVYRILISLGFVFLEISFYRFIAKISRLLGSKVDKAKVFYLSILLFIYILSFLPSIYEFFYWYAAVTVYLFSYIAFLLFLEFAVKIYQEEKVNFSLFVLVVIFLNGNNELFIGITNSIVLFLFLNYYLKNKKLNLKLLIVNILSWISTLILLLSPGMLSRRGEFHYGGNLWGSLKVAIIYGTKYTFLHFIELPSLFFYLFFFIFLYKYISRSNPLKYISPLYLGIVSFLCILSQYFLIYYATGLLQHTGRVGNIIRLTEFAFLILNILNLVVYLKTRKKIKILNNTYLTFSVLLIFFTFLLVNNKNYHDLKIDFTSNSYDRYEKEFQQRSKLISDFSNDTIQLEKIFGTRLLRSPDRLLENNKWIRDCYINLINNKYNTHIKEIEFINAIK